MSAQLNVLLAGGYCLEEVYPANTHSVFSCCFLATLGEQFPSARPFCLILLLCPGPEHTGVKTSGTVDQNNSLSFLNFLETSVTWKKTSEPWGYSQ